MKKCSRCTRIISDRKKSGLCRYCYIYECQKAKRIKRSKNNLCADCGKKVKITKCPHCDKVIKYFYRCEKCIESIKINKRDLSSFNK